MENTVNCGTRRHGIIPKNKYYMVICILIMFLSIKISLCGIKLLFEMRGAVWLIVFVL